MKQLSNQEQLIFTLILVYNKLDLLRLYRAIKNS